MRPAVNRRLVTLAAAAVLISALIWITWARPQWIRLHFTISPRVIHDQHVQAYRRYLDGGGTLRDERFGRALGAVVNVARNGGTARENDVVYAVGLPDRRTIRGGVTYLEYDARGLGSKTTFISFDNRGVLQPNIGLMDPPRRRK
jgi:hypothetical protein